MCLNVSVSLHLFDHVLLETTGLADPAPIVAMLWLDDALEASIRLDALITLVDARNFQRCMCASGHAHSNTLPVPHARPASTARQGCEGEGRGGEGGEGEGREGEGREGEGRGGERRGGEQEEDGGQGGVQAVTHGAEEKGLEDLLLQQVAYADVVIVNKLDLLAPSPHESQRTHIEATQKEARSEQGGGREGEERREAAVRAVVEAVRGINAGAEVVTAVRSQVDVRMLLNRGLYSAQRGHDILQAMKQHIPMTTTEQRHSHEHTAASPPRTHASISTFSFTCSGSVHLQKVDEWLGAVLWEGASQYGDIYRMKGAMEVQGSNRVHVFQAVRELYEVLAALPWPQGEERLNRVLVVGKRLNTSAIEQGFKACMAL
ncbi:hypothetical protein CLOM_g22201 [Closterium sp. NIES-68]|nr:hypothetical protein CLOM_g22201 [Closterium sp. NIES-68]GJP80269.1 hypothetical protein CLOP_g10498 [Closterium sp. NIES-67]